MSYLTIREAHKSYLRVEHQNQQTQQTVIKLRVSVCTLSCIRETNYQRRHQSPIKSEFYSLVLPLDWAAAVWCWNICIWLEKKGGFWSWQHGRILMLHVSTSVLHQAGGSGPTVPDDWAMVDLLNHALHGNMIQTTICLWSQSKSQFYKPFFL